MKPPPAWIALPLLLGCGRTAHSGDALAGNNSAGAASAPVEDNSAGAASGGADSFACGVGPIDATGQPDALPMTCEGRKESLAFKLPCLIGEPPLYAVECELAGFPKQAAVSFFMPLTRLPQLLNQPIKLPFDGVPQTATQGVVLDAERFDGTIVGVVTFSQIDVGGRAFVGRLEQAHVVWSGDRGSQFSCSTLDGPFWAVAGAFL